MDIDNVLIMFLYNLHFKRTIIEFKKIYLDVPISISRDDQETRRVHTAFLPHYCMWIKSKKAQSPEKEKKHSAVRGVEVALSPG